MREPPGREPRAALVVPAVPLALVLGLGAGLASPGAAVPTPAVPTAADTVEVDPPAEPSPPPPSAGPVLVGRTAATAPDSGPGGSGTITDGLRPPFLTPSVSVLVDRRSRFLDRLEPGLALLSAARRRDLESEYPQASDFRQDSDFLYLTGLETPGAALALYAGPDGVRRQVLFLAEAAPGEARWVGPTPDAEEAVRTSGILDVRPMGGLRDWVGELRPCGDPPLYAPSLRRARAGGPVERVVVSTRGVRDVRPIVASLRLVKDPFELSLVRRAVEITDRGLAEAARTVGPGTFEYEVEARLEYVFRSLGAERVGFPSIVASGPNAVVLHYDDSRRRMRAGELIVVDAGAEYSYYTADVTRTLPVSGRFTPRQRALYGLVLGAWEAAVDAVRPGATMADVEGAARRHLREGSGELCGETSCVRHFVHGVGHWLGMDVHDPGSYRRPFEPGMVLTVEPGLYLPDEALGIRIEDDVLVTETGREVLSRTPRTSEGVEAMMAAGEGP